MNRQELKEWLIRIKDNNYAVPEGAKPDKLSLSMLEHIGDTDMELRDSLILPTLSEWIINHTLPSDEVISLLLTALDEQHLLLGLGEEGDNVFCRTFCAEVIACIIYRHRQEAFLSEQDVRNAFQTLIGFYNGDRDVRGYVYGKGWAHGAAHGADALDEFARCEEIGCEGLREILKAIYKKVNTGCYGYIHFEDERMITAVEAVLDRKVLPSEEVTAWIRSFCRIEKTGEDHENLVKEFNINVFLKSLYFRLVDQPEYRPYAEAAKESIKEINRFIKKQ